MTKRNFDNLAPNEYLSVQLAAELNIVITVRCGLCRRQTHFLAEDLIHVVGSRHFVKDPMWPCFRCRTVEYVKNSWQPRNAHHSTNGLVVRRPVKQVTRWIWRTETLQS